MNTLKLVASIAVAGICISCASTDFQGDGTLVDRGPLAAKDRYILDLGIIDLTKPGKHVYSISNLPDETFIVGLEVVEKEPSSSAASTPGRVHLVVENGARQLVIDESRALNSWTRSSSRLDTRSFLYTSGNGSETAARLDVRADQGWGTYFVPKAGEQYHLKVEVLEVQRRPQLVRLMLKGGGWK
jgi:hypothetical protein